MTGRGVRSRTTRPCRSSGIHLVDIDANVFERAADAVGAEQGFLVAVAVQHDVLCACGEFPVELAGVEFVCQERVDHLHVACDTFGHLLVVHQVGQVVNERRGAARFECEDGQALFGVGIEVDHRLGAVTLGVFSEPLGQSRALAAAGLGDADAVAEAFQEFDGGEADVRLVIVGVGIVEEHDVFAVGVWSGFAAAQQLIERLFGERRQFAASVDAGDLLEDGLEKWCGLHEVGDRGEQAGGASCASVGRAADRAHPAMCRIGRSASAGRRS